MNNKVKSLLSVVLVGSSLALGGSVKANSFATPVIASAPCNLEIGGTYSVIENGMLLEFKNLPRVIVKDENLKGLTENELTNLYVTYKEVLKTGIDYTSKTFPTCGGEKLGLIEYDKYVYSLMLECKINNIDISVLTSVYAEMVGVRDCILNFSLVAETDRVSQLAVLDNSNWLKSHTFK